MRIDLNCDLGEGVIINGEPVETLIMPFITSANIACGLHAGDPLTMTNTIELALQHGVGIGAHPGYNDREAFGRRPMNISYDELRAIIMYQTGAIKTMTEVLGGRVQHVKLHGALYNKAASDFDVAEIFIKTIMEIDPAMIIVGPPGSEICKAALMHKLAFAAEAFADRAYNDDGSLVSRTLPGSVIEDTSIMTERVMQIVMNQNIETITGKNMTLQAETICVHGDNPHALSFVKILNASLKRQGIELKSIGNKQ
jgi:5-oxoprolinase (ATP-hydrolysing) subunit A